MESFQIQLKTDHNKDIQSRIHFVEHCNTIAIILHPYPVLGGNFNDPVVIYLEQLFQKSGISTCCYNMKTTSWTGIAERDELLGICKVLTMHLKNQGIKDPLVVLAGYSYGSMVACEAASKIKNLKALVSFGYPAGVLFALTAFNSQRIMDSLCDISAEIPKLFIIGTRDNFTSIATWNKVLEPVPGPKNMAIIHGMDHFLNGDQKCRADFANEMQMFIKAALISGLP